MPTSFITLAVCVVKSFLFTTFWQNHFVVLPPHTHNMYICVIAVHSLICLSRQKVAWLGIQYGNSLAYTCIQMLHYFWNNSSYSTLTHASSLIPRCKKKDPQNITEITSTFRSRSWSCNLNACILVGVMVQLTCMWIIFHGQKAWEVM